MSSHIWRPVIKILCLSHKAELWLTDNDHRNTNRGPSADSPNYMRHLCKHLYFPVSCTCKQALGNGKKFSRSETDRNADPRITCNYDSTKPYARTLCYPQILKLCTDVGALLNIYPIYFETINFIIFHLEIDSHTPNFEVSVYPSFPASFHLGGSIYYSLGSLEQRGRNYLSRGASPNYLAQG